MNKKRSLIFIPFITIIIIACLLFFFIKEEKTEYDKSQDFTPFLVDINKSVKNVVDLPLSTITGKLEYVLLETTTESYLDEVVKVALSDSFIFVSDVRKLLQFDRQGNFIRQIGNSGRGPEEYIRVSDFSINNRREFVYIYSANPGVMLVFNFRGNFIKSFKFKAQSVQFESDSMNRFMFHLINLGNRKDTKSYSWLLSDLEGNIILRISYSLDLEYKLGRFGNPVTPLYVYKGDFHFMEYGIDTMYYLNNLEKRPYSIFNISDLKMDIDIRIESQEDYAKYEGKLWIYNILEDHNYLYLTTISGISPNKTMWVYNKRTRELVRLKDKGFVDDYYELATFWPRSVFNDSVLIDYIEAFKMHEILKNKNSEFFINLGKTNSEKIMALKNDLKEISNPILMIVNQ